MGLAYGEAVKGQEFDGDAINGLQSGGWAPNLKGRHSGNPWK